jgi:biotin carboxylase
MIERKADIVHAVKRAQEESFSKQAIIEEFVPGSEISVESISWEGKHYVLAITDKGTTGEPFIVECEHHQPTHLSTEIQLKVKTITQQVLAALDVKYGASHSEFKITDKGEIYVIEVGARMGGDFIGSDLVKLSTGYDFVKGVIEAALGIFEEPVLTENKYSGVYFLCKETEYVKSYIENYTHYPEIVSAEITDNELHAVQCSADRSGYFIYQADKKMKI